MNCNHQILIKYLIHYIQTVFSENKYALDPQEVANYVIGNIYKLVRSWVSQAINKQISILVNASIECNNNKEKRELWLLIDVASCTWEALPLFMEIKIRITK